MSRSNRAVTYGLLPLLLVIGAVGLRVYFFSGFVLCDDVEEFSLIQSILTTGPDFKGHLQYRVPMWWFNVALLKLVGTSEAAFFAPTLVMSATLPAVGYLLLSRAGYSRFQAVLGSLVVSTAPFEVLLGTLRANDLILSWFLAIALLAFVSLENQPLWQGISVGVLLWLAFYAKLWVVYVLPPLAVYYAYQLLALRRWRAPLAFVLTSAALHAGTALYWRAKMGTLIPFLQFHSATYPVPTRDLPNLLKIYPHLIFSGSEFGTTLFGIVPYILLLLLAVKAALTLRPTAAAKHPLALDRLDLILLASYSSFFMFLNFFPNNFAFDQYYSAPRIFRYLAPLSFPIALHVGKLLIDATRALPPRFSPWLAAVVFAPVLVTNFAQAAEATGPGRLARRAVLAVLRDIRSACPPRLLVEAWQAYWFEQVYLRDSCARGSVVPIYDTFSAGQYERWLTDHEGALPEGTMMITGLGSCVHYGCHTCGFLLRLFRYPLSSRWVLVKEHDTLSYLPMTEPVRTWRLSAQTTLGQEPNVSEPKVIRSTPEETFRRGLELFEASNYTEARRYFSDIVRDHENSPVAEDATYFRAITYWREGDRQSTIREFSELLTKYPGGHWSAGAHYHIGLACKELRDVDRARREFSYILSHFASDVAVARMAETALADLPTPSLWRRLSDWLTLKVRSP